MKKMSMTSLLAAATVFVNSAFAKARPTRTLTASLIDLDALRAKAPRAVAAMPRAKAQTAEELLADIKTGFEEFKASVDQQLQAKADDTVLSEKIERINSSLTDMEKAWNAMQAQLAAAKIGGAGAASVEVAAHRDAFNAWFRKGTEPENMRELEVSASLTTQVDPDGGYLVPEEMDTTIDRVLGTVSTMRQLARVITLGTGGSYTKLINQGGASSGWVGEEEARPETSSPRLAQINIPLHEIYANPAATQTLLDDARVDIAAWLAEEVSIEFDEEEGAAFISGDGIKRPKGLLTNTKVANASYAWGKLGYIAGGAASDFATGTAAVDSLIDLYYALKSGYRGNASWLMADAVLGKVRKFKDGDGNFIWAPPSSTADVASVLQKAVYTDDNMDAVGAGKFPIAFGDFRRAYTIVQKGGTRVLRDPFSNKPYVQFYTTRRVGGAVTNFEAVKLLKIATS